MTFSWTRRRAWAGDDGNEYDSHEPKNLRVQEGVSPEKSLGASLEKGLKVKRESRVPTFEKNDTKNPLLIAEEAVVEGAAAEEEEEVAAAAEVEERRWRSEVR